VTDRDNPAVVRARGRLSVLILGDAATAQLGLIDDNESVLHSRLAGHGPSLFAGLSMHLDLTRASRQEVGPDIAALRYEPRTPASSHFA
jgi:hypothetical protein